MTKRRPILQLLTVQRGRRTARIRGGDEFDDGFDYIPAGREDLGMEREKSEYNKAPDESCRKWKERHETAVGQLRQSILDDIEW
jgi:hypothetical protein